ncbi:hypothetical protein GCM10010521_75540 [Streptomyces rameus]|uniref:Uncharacterized protein n=1 Tax=Streptomyces rameus TaxID=68261 RepID=A0ABN3VAH1_9ACTN
MGARSVRLGWDNLTTAQQRVCEQVLGIEPAADDEKPSPRRTQADKWAMNYAAAKQSTSAKATYEHRESRSNGSPSAVMGAAERSGTSPRARGAPRNARGTPRPDVFVEQHPRAPGGAARAYGPGSRPASHCHTR